jgi:hypothetical protein
MKHYIYKLINTKTNMEYIGVRSAVDPENDDYMGSGTFVTWAYNNDRPYFIKRILEVFTDRETAEEREEYYVDEYYVLRPDTYNLKTGGKYGSVIMEKVLLSKDYIQNTVVKDRPKLTETYGKRPDKYYIRAPGEKSKRPKFIIK